MPDPTTPPAWLARYLPDATDLAASQSWQAQLAATDALVAAEEAERLQKVEALKEQLRPAYSQETHAVYMRQWRAKRHLLAQALGLAKPPYK